MTAERADAPANGRTAKRRPRPSAAARALASTSSGTGWLDAEAAWQLHGACRFADPELFFHPHGERGRARAARERRALQICASCPVLQQCREHALAVPETIGVWGGMTEEDRIGARGADAHPAGCGGGSDADGLP